MRKGYFIVFEGPDGSGKTTISRLVAEQLMEDYPIVYTREPGGIEIAEKIRDIILDPENVKMDVKTEALLYAASRRQHFVEKIKPTLENDGIVVCDRFVESSLAYQGVGRQIGIEDVFQINQFAIEGWMPDLTIFLDIAPEVGLQRLQSRQFKDRLDQEGIDFHNRVYQGYQAVLNGNNDHIQKIDANKSIDEIVAESINIIKGKLENR